MFWYLYPGYLRFFLAILRFAWAAEGQWHERGGPKPETAQENPLAPRVLLRMLKLKKSTMGSFVVRTRVLSRKNITVTDVLF